MAVTPVNFAIIIALLITLFTNPYVCLCSCTQQESEALISFNITLPKGFQWANGTDCCKWYGIQCDQHMNHVVDISLYSYAFSNPDESELKGGVLSDSLCNLPFLTSILLSNFGLTGTLPSCLGKLSYLQSLVIIQNGLSGIIPPTICMLSNLTVLALDGNQLRGNLPSCLGNLSSLSSLFLSNNQLTGQIPISLGNLSSLLTLDVSYNQLSGALPSSFAGLSSLSELKADGNAFNESIPYWALPSSIVELYLSLNHHVTISETFFHNLPKLNHLYLSNCILNISTTWIPQFQLNTLQLISCKTDGQIPSWISTQFSLQSLTLSNNSLSGEIPSWLWDNHGSLYYLNLSGNYLSGRLFPNDSIISMTYLDMSRNALTGHIPSLWPPSMSRLVLNDNLFVGNIPPNLCNLTELLQIDLANNKLTGSIPPCFVNNRLKVLNLGNNSLNGKIPQGLCLSSFIIKNNKLSGHLPPSITNCTTLQIFDVGQNSFTGHIPNSIGNLSALQVLVMKGNRFRGNIPLEIGQLKQLQVLDLSSNNISGFIPHNIVSLQAMTVAREDGYILNNALSYGRYGMVIESSNDELDMTTKGREQHYPYILSTLTGIDLSNNQLNGNVPSDFGKLKGLRFLNLSMNKLSGIIPSSLGEMSQLESLDLSTNQFYGIIPWELQSLSYLAALNLSNNNLSGSIPQGGQMITFENTSYSGNPNLQGCPLPRNCPWPKFTHPPPTHDAEEKSEEQSKEIPWFEIGLGLSHGAGFSGVVLLLAVRKGWRHKYFKRVDKILKFLFPSLRNKRL